MTTHAFYPLYQLHLINSLKVALKNFSPKYFFYGVRCLPYLIANKVICLSDIEKKYVLKEFEIEKSKIAVIPNGVDLSRFEKKYYDFRKKHKISFKYLILYVGQVIDLKGISYLFYAFEKIVKQGYDCGLVILTYNLNEKIFEDSKQLGIRNRMFILLDPNEENIISAYKNCDIFVLPSLTECFPTVLLEAMAAKKPIITTNVGGIPNLIKDHYNGLLVKPRDVNELTNKIILLLKSDSLRKEMGRNGYNSVCRKYDWNIIIDDVINLYKSIIK